MDGYLTLSEAARALGIKNTSQLRKLIDAGGLKAQKAGTIWIVDEDEVVRYKSRRKMGRPRRRPAPEETP